MRCPKCNQENPPQARFCRFCGERLTPEESDALAPRVLTPEERSRRLLEDAFRLSEEGRVQSAIQVCQQAIALNPSSTSAHSLLGTLYERIGDRAGAIREYEQVLTLSPGSTVERRRLNELMGVATAAEPGAVRPRTVRMAVTGGFVVVALVLVSLIVLTTQQPQKPTRQPGTQALPQRQLAQREVAPPSFEVSSPRMGSFGRTRIASAWATPPRQPRGPAVPQQGTAQAQGYGQYLGEGAYQLPASSGPAYGGLANQGAANRGYGPPPIAGAVPYRGGPTPTVSAPGSLQTRPSAGQAGAARNYYLRGDYRQAANAYRSYLASNPQAAAPREELAWVYTQAGEYQTARQEYRVALDRYQNDLAQGHNVEAAKHGVRTCESAIRALETQ